MSCIGQTDAPRQDHICTEHRCCCCRLAFSRCVWCLPLEDRGGTAALQPRRWALHRGSPPGKNENETSPWKTDEWSCLPSRHSSDGERREWKSGRRQLIDQSLSIVIVMTHFKKGFQSGHGSQMTFKEAGWWLNKYVRVRVWDRKTKRSSWVFGHERKLDCLMKHQRLFITGMFKHYFLNNLAWKGVAKAVAVLAFHFIPG